MFEQSLNSHPDQPFLAPILKSSANLLHCKNTQQLLACVHNTIAELALDGFYRLDSNREIHIKYFLDGQLLNSNNRVPQGNSHHDHVTVVDLEHSLTFKLPFIQFHLKKTANTLPLNKQQQDLLLMWLQQVSGVLVQLEHQLTLQHLFSNKQEKLKQNVEKLNEKMAQTLAALSQQQVTVAQDYTQLVTQKGVTGQQYGPEFDTALQDHGLAINDLIQKQDSLNLCIVDLLKSVNEHLE